MYNHKIVNTDTGQEIIEPLSEEEIAIVEANLLQTQKELEDKKAKEEIAKKAKLLAQAKLEALGLTADDLTALGL
jgi:hypothetical protein